MNKLSFLITLILGIATLGMASENKGKEIFVKQDQMDKGYQDQQARLKMTLINVSGDKVVRILDSKRFEMKEDGDLSIIRFHKPNDVRDTGLLTYEHQTGLDDQ